MKTKLLKEYLRLRKRPRFETGDTNIVWHKILATFVLFLDILRWQQNMFYHCKTVSILPQMRL